MRLSEDLFEVKTRNTKFKPRDKNKMSKNEKWK